MYSNTNTSGPNLFPREQGSTVSSAAVSTGTITNAAPTPTASNNGGNNQGSGVTGSPPLIVAFLAVGVFLAAMLTIFGWRRVVFARGIVMRPLGRDGFNTPRNTEHLGERPELWEFWTQPIIGSHEQLKWEQIIPLSASVKRSDDEHDLRSQTADVHTYSRIPAQFQSIQRHIRRHTHPAKSAGDAGSGESQILQVAVAIAMPSPHQSEPEPTKYNISSPDNEHHEYHDVKALEYSLGLTQIPWHSEER